MQCKAAEQHCTVNERWRGEKRKAWIRHLPDLGTWVNMEHTSEKGKVKQAILRFGRGVGKTCHQFGEPGDIRESQVKSPPQAV